MYIHPFNVCRLIIKVNTLLCLIALSYWFIFRLKFFREYLQKIYKSKWGSGIFLSVDSNNNNY